MFGGFRLLILRNELNTDKRIGIVQAARVVYLNIHGGHPALRACPTQPFNAGKMLKSTITEMVLWRI